MEVGGDNVFELEDASTIEEVSNPVVTLDSVILQELFDLPNPKASEVRTSAKSTRMHQMMLLEKMDARRLKLKPEIKDNCHAH